MKTPPSGRSAHTAFSGRDCRRRHRVGYRGKDLLEHLSASHSDEFTVSEAARGGWEVLFLLVGLAEVLVEKRSLWLHELLL